MRKLAWPAAAILGLAFLSGCGFKDIDQRFFVIAVGVDRGQNSAYKISLKLAIPSAKTEPGESKSIVVSQEADSIAEAVRLMKSKVDKEFDFGQAKVIVIGKPYADSRELGTSLDWFYRRRDIQEIAYMAIGEPDAFTAVSTKPASERYPGNSLIMSFTREGTDSPYIVTEPLFDYYRRIHDFGKDPYLPIIEAEKDSFTIRRVAVMHHSRKVMELSEDETATFNQLVRQFPRFIIRTSVEGRPVTFYSVKTRVKYRILTPRSGPPEIRYTVKVLAEAEDSHTRLYGLNWKSLEKIIERHLEQKYTELLEKLQRVKADPVGFGIRYRATRHQGRTEYETWQTVYPNVKFNVNVKVRFWGTGIIE